MTYQLAENAAWFIAENAHYGQKYGDEPYINHIKRVFLRVSEITENRGINEITKLVSILHDTVEDSDVSLDEIEELFGARVRFGVDSITRKKEEDYFEYIKRLSQNNVSKIVKVCDLLDNLQHCYLNSEKHEIKIKKYEKAICMLMLPH